jgi:FlaA1/EpsC-like NDP-sugar epimerase
MLNFYSIDLEINEVGLRRGEKLHEVLSSSEDDIKETEHEKILEVNISTALSRNKGLIPLINQDSSGIVISRLVNGLQEE